MKYLLFIMAGLALVGASSAAEFCTVDGPSYQGIMPPGPRTILVTQNANTTFIEPVQVACGVAGQYTTQNFYLRRFFLAQDHGLRWFYVYGVYFGVEQLAMADGTAPPPYDVTVRLYTIPSGAAFTFDNMRVIGSGTVTLAATDIGTILYAPVFASVLDGEDYDLVVALDAPDGSTIGAGLSFRPGANTFGATWDAYIASADCGVPEPIGVSDVGFPDSQTIFVVQGDASGIDPPPPPPSSVDEAGPDSGGATELASWGKVKALYR